MAIFSSGPLPSASFTFFEMFFIDSRSASVLASSSEVIVALGSLGSLWPS
ncbi:MAG TPA: hypothetical protein VGX76_22450 [Pirellulales bacterium]|nr:hypothetical protein [Pirellulales bacterium]